MPACPFFSLYFFAIQTILAHGCFQHEREALIEFKAGVNDPSGRLVSWRGDDCCTWAGIKCSNQTGHVVKLDLSSTSYYSDSNNTFSLRKYSNNILSGKFKSSLFALGDLKHLDLSYNDFSENTFPDFICLLRNLNYLDLSYMGLSGTIPSQLSNLSRLEYLDLSYNGLSGLIPPQLSNISKLQYLALGAPYSSTDLPIIANMWWLSCLTSLKYLSLSMINLQDSREWLQPLTMLSSLEKLYLERNNLTTIPPFLSVVNFSSLTTLSLVDNKFNTLIPNWIGQLTSLTELELVSCSFIGSVPSMLDKLISLNTLIIHESLEGPLPPLHNLNNLTNVHLISIYINEGITELMSKLSNETQEKLEHLYLRNTSLTGNLTGWLKKYKMTSLKSLVLGRNKLNDTIPAEIGNLTNLVELGLSRNSFTGEISELHFTRLSKLIFLDLAYNSITVTIDSNWAPLFQLEFLDARACVLGPKFPSWLQNQNNLMQVYLSNTRIVDSVPDWFWNLASFSYIDLSHNNIPGKLTESDCSYAFTCLKVIDLSSNNISGDLPRCFPNTLQAVNLANNKIAGTIPNSLGSLNMLMVLQLNNNNLTGELPLSLQFCKNLIVLDLGDNQFYGQIPEWLGESLPKLTVLQLRSNSFSGNIPSQITHLGNLQVLDLSDNNISGSIPQNMDTLLAMASSNQDGRSNSALANFLSYDNDYYNLSISVCTKGLELEYFTNFALLKSIDLSRNNLMGEIPQNITALLGLSTLNLSYNNLNGTIPNEIGNMQSLESLDFRMNKLSGIIPYSLAELHFLTTINLSYNNLSGEIPMGDQLQTLLDPYIYTRNAYLCGSPLNKSCNTNETSDSSLHDNNKNLDEELLYLFAVLGFGFGFWVFFGILIFKRNWRYRLFQMMDNMFDSIYVFVMLYFAN